MKRILSLAAGFLATSMAVSSYADDTYKADTTHSSV
jgi:hypothetical protein